MKNIKRTALITFGSLLALTTPASVLALAAPATAANNTPNTSAQNTQKRLSHLKTRGSSEINRRLLTLNKLYALINSSSKLSATDRSNLTNQVKTEISNLTALQAKLNQDTDLATARTDVQSIYTEYRVYALVVPQVHLLNTADRELVNDDKLSSLAVKLQDRITSAKSSGKDVASLQSLLDDMNAKTANAKSTANAVNAKVALLQPSDFNSYHAVLSGQRDQLKTAHQDNITAYNDAKAIVSGLKNL